VEPCILNGRIESCGDNGAFGLSLIFDMESILKSHENFRMINYRDFSQILVLRKTKKKVCYQDGTTAFKTNAQLFKKDIYGEEKFNEIENTNHALEHCVRAYDYSNSVVYLYNPWVAILLHRERASFMTIDLKFKRLHYVLVNMFLRQSGINKQFTVFNWRSELVPFDSISRCATYVVSHSFIWSKQLRLNRTSQMVFVSDINLAGSGNSTRPLWLGQAKLQNVISDKTIGLLRENFFQLSSSPAVNNYLRNHPIYNDTAFLTIWELITSETATLFVTCIVDHGLAINVSIYIRIS